MTGRTFLHLSDLHFRRRYPAAAEGYASLFHRMTPPLEQLAVCLGEIDARALDFVLVTGDLTEDGDAGDYAALRRALERSFAGIPVCVTPGNHDSRDGFYRGWLESGASGGPFHHIYRIGDAAVLSLDSSAPGECPDGRIGLQEVRWLRGALAEIGRAPCLLMTHHHLRPDQFDMPAARCEESFFAAVEQSHISGVFCGHTHHGYVGWLAGKPYYTGGSLSFSAAPRPEGVVFEERSSANLCHWSEEGIAVHHIPLLPKSAPLWVAPY